MSWTLLALAVLWVAVREAPKWLPARREPDREPPFVPQPPTLTELSGAVDLTAYLQDPDQKD